MAQDPPVDVLIPEAVEQQALVYGLGKPIKVYKSSHPLFSIALIVGSMLLMFVIFAAMVYVHTLFPSGIVYSITLAPLFVVIFAVRSLVKGSVQAYVYSEGFLRARGRRYEAIRWGQVESVWYKYGKHSYGPRLTITVRLDDSNTLQFDDTIGFADVLLMRIQEHVGKRLLPRLLEEFQRKKVVTFGQINVDSQGINNGKELVPWDQVDKIAISEDDEFVVVIKNGHPLKWSPVKVQDTPNLDTLIRLVEVIVKERKQASV